MVWFPKLIFPLLSFYYTFCDECHSCTTGYMSPKDSRYLGLMGTTASTLYKTESSGLVIMCVFFVLAL